MDISQTAGQMELDLQKQLHGKLGESRHDIYNLSKQSDS